MVRVMTGDLLDSDAQTLVNAVNCVGVMSKGIALAFKRRFPDMFADYAERCQRGEVHLGELYLYRGPSLPSILNFPTKAHWRSPAKLEDIVAGLAYLETHYQEWGITSLAVPALGCGAGQLDWVAVRPILVDALGRLDIPVELYAPAATPPNG
jgi:O-acetyl-ADP-ribose deacetylase (regulator of RNase III)